MATEATLRSKVANWLVQYLGITEGSTEHKAILAVFNDSGLCSRYKMTTSDAWCAAATSAAFIACGLSSIFPCVECSCPKMVSLAQTAGIWEEDDSYTPSVGDVILYDWQDSGSGDNTGSPDHVGIVYSISGTAMKIIEGNKSDTVAYRTLQVNGKYIRGYIVPNYASVATSSAADTGDSSSGSTLAAGTKITLSGANLYASAGASKAAGTKTGTFYIWSSAVTNGRIRITNSAANVGKTGQVTGWVDTSDCAMATTTSSASASSTTTSSGASSGTKKTATDSAASFLKSLAGTYTVTANGGLNVRNGAGTGKSVMVTLPKGTSVKNYGYYTASGGVKWLYIQVAYNGVTYTGFASSAYLKKS